MAKTCKARIEELEAQRVGWAVACRKVGHGPLIHAGEIEKATADAFRKLLAVVEAAQPIFDDIRATVAGWQSNPAYERHPPEIGVTLKTNAGVLYAISDALADLDGKENNDG